CGAGESAVGDEAHTLAEASAHDIGGGCEHLLHAGAAARAFVADDDDVAGFDFVFEDAGGGGFFGFENHGGAFELVHGGMHGAGFQNGAIGGEVAEEDGEAALLAVGIVEGADDV